MRCKVGDLVIIVRVENDPGLLGKLATVVSKPRPTQPPSEYDWLIDIHNHPSWYPTGMWSAYDKDLRPIRDNDGEDETLTWKQLERV